MVPLKLSLKNFLSYSEDAPVLDFSKFTVACLSGKNGHGKSALLDALTWALWGKCRVKTKEEVIKRGAKQATVELEFDVDGNCYRVLRTISRTRGFATSTSIEFQVFDAETSAYKSLDGGAKTQDSIEKILKMDYESFTCSSFILQGRADEFTKKTPAERKEVIAGILELEKYEKLAKRARDFALRSKQDAELAERDLSYIESEISQKPSLENRLKEVEDRGGKTAGELRGIEKLYEEVIREFEVLKTKTESYNKLVKDIDETHERRVRSERELNRLIGEIERDREVIFNESEILEGYREFGRAKEEEKVFSEKLINYTGLIKELEKINRLINDERSGIEREISSLGGKKEELQNRLIQAKKILEREEEVKAGFKELMNTKSVDKGLEEKRGALEKLKSRRMELESGIQKIRFQVESQVRGFEAKIKEFSEKSENIGGLTEECENLRVNIETGEETLLKCERLKAELKEIGEEKKASISRRSEIEKRQKEEAEKLVILKSQPEKPHCPLCESVLSKEAKEALIQKLEKSILELENALKEESRRIEQMAEDEKRAARQIRMADREIRSLPLLNKQLGEKEKSLRDALSARNDLELAKGELNKIKSVIENENFAHELRGELKYIMQKMTRLAYDEEEHREIRDKLESLRSFQTEKELLEDARKNKDETESQLRNIKNEISALMETLHGGTFATRYREQASGVLQRIQEMNYDEEKHKELMSTLGKLERFSEEKEKLERIKLGLDHKEKERERLERQLDAENERLKNMQEEIKELKDVVDRSEAIEEKKRVIESRVSELKTEKDEALREKSGIKYELDRVVALENKKEELSERAEKLSRDLTVYQELDKAFGKNGIQALIIENAVPEIEAEGNIILRKLTDGTMTLSLEMLKPTQKGGEKETLDIKIGDSSGTRSYETFSGGEAFRIDFALRVAISKFIANRSGARLRTLVVDEGFGSQDKDGLNQFIHVINTVKDDFDKILVITHVDELKDKFPVRIEVTKEPGKGSSFETVYS